MTGREEQPRQHNHRISSANRKRRRLQNGRIGRRKRLRKRKETRRRKTVRVLEETPARKETGHGIGDRGS